MTRTLSEKKVLKKLGITDFRHMTKDKIIKFASMLPNMDPEVAKKALEQFPTFKDLASDLVTHYKDIVEKAFNANQNSQQSFYETCNSIIESLQQELKKDNTTSDERSRIEDKMIEVAKMIADKDSENKRFILTTVSGVGGIFLVVVGVAASILGSNTQISKNNDCDDTNGNNVSYNSI